jgi:hypothetical protein
VQCQGHPKKPIQFEAVVWSGIDIDRKDGSSHGSPRHRPSHIEDQRHQNALLAFVGLVKDGSQGVYAKEGGSLQVIANTNTSTPGFSGKFNEFDTRGSASIDHGVVAFSAFSRGANNSVNEGIYTSSNGSLSLVADRSTTLPFGTGGSTFIFIDRPMINNGNVIFNAAGAGGAAGVF